MVARFRFFVGKKSRKEGESIPIEQQYSFMRSNSVRIG